MESVPATIMYDMENSTESIRTIIVFNSKYLPEWFTKNKDLIIELQLIHDELGNWDSDVFVGEKDLQTLAIEKHLQYKGKSHD